MDIFTLFHENQSAGTHWDIFEAVEANEIVDDDTDPENLITHREITLKHLPTGDTEVFRYTITDGIITLEAL